MRRITQRSFMLLAAAILLLSSSPLAAQDLIITGAIDGPLSGGIPKAVELYAVNSIPDLSIYGFGSANNGGGTDGEEFTFPAVPVAAGTFMYLASESTAFTSFFGFAPDFTDSSANVNGDDALELFESGVVIDTFGEINVDGTGQPWEYLDGWAYRVDLSGPDGATFNLANWTFSGPNALDGETTNGTAVTPFPLGTYTSGTAPAALLISGVVDGPITGGLPKAIEFYAYDDIADLSVYGFGSANNGGGTDGEEFTFPAVAVTAGTFLYLASETTEFTNFFGFAPDFTDSSANNNGDDALELFFNGAVIDTFGEINVDGTGQPWEYLDGWAYRVDGTGPDGAAFDLANWTFSGPNALDGETSNATAAVPFPIGSYLFVPLAPPALIMTGAVDGPLTGGIPKAIEFFATDDIADLSLYGFGSANNGGGSDGEEFTFPAVAVTAGSFIYLASESTAFTTFFGFAPDFTDSSANVNGDDALELFYNGAVIDTFGDINVDGTGQPWEYLDGWAYRVPATGPDGATFVLTNWTFSGPNALDGEATNGTAATPWPIGTFSLNEPPALLISGVIDGPLSGGIPKAIEFFAFADIADLSAYGFGSANNGGGSDGEEFTFPAIAVTAGTYLYAASESTGFTTFFGFAPDFTDSAANVNGDDAIELFQDGAVIDTFGDINVDGTGQPWEYLDGWAYRVNGTGPDGATFVLANWTFSGPNALDGETDNGSAATPFPIGTFLGGGENPPQVQSTTPSNGTTISAVDANLTIEFSEDVNVAGAWFDISCTTSGAVTATVSGGPQIFTLDPAIDLAGGETCTVTIFAAGVTDVDLDDPPDNMSADFVFSFFTPIEAEIFEIQGSGAASPFVGLNVTTRDNVVTGVRSNGFFIQTPDARSDADSTTSDGIFVFTGGAPAVSFGDLVDVSGTIVEFFDFTEYDDNGLTVTVTASGAAQPTPVLLDAFNPDPGPFSPADLERFEGMVVRLENGLTSAPTDRFGDTAVVVGPERAFREPGIEFPGLVGLPEWDGNQEVFEIDPDGIVGMADVEFFAETTIVEAQGPLAFSFGDYQILPTQTVVFGPDPALPRAVRAKAAGEFTIASQNMLRLFDDVDDPGGDPVLSPTEFADTIAMFSEHIRLNLGTPDVVAFQEVENINVLQTLATRIAADGGPTYSAHLIEGNDVGGIDVGYLTQDGTISVNSVDQFGENLTLSFDGSLLHDRPPLVLDATYIGGGASFPFTVINVHQRSLGGIDDPADGTRVKTKRLEQAETVAQFIQDLQTLNPTINLVVTGDFNAFQFTDGFVDVLGSFTGSPDPAGAEFPSADLVNPDLTNQVLSLPADEQYSFIFGGNAQVLDHALTSQALTPLVTELAYARGNADAPDSLFDDLTTTLRASDHDGLVLYLLADSDADGVADEADACPGTVIPEDVPTRHLGFFRYALVDGDTTFDTRTPWWWPHEPQTFTTVDTAGCSCEQIIDELHLGNFQRKYGCGLGVMLFWTWLVEDL
ncbi:MAG: Ig-like domain-containing protein [Acidobacteriota bacterium]